MRPGWIVTVGRNIYTIDNNLRPRAKDGEFADQICTVQGDRGCRTRLGLACKAYMGVPY